ncbi:MAG: hypothetical protein FWE91_07135 [Defluviitaleaceae bacterium]|nr:hypothetical protein [Defluviitaleaceae bacterium]MCL2836572.1 hypothetical protein [Defluviitaleaceae bacterium]
MSSSENFRLMPVFKPSLTEGEYTIIANQKVTDPVSHEFPEARATVYVGTKHFSIPSDEVHSVYPPPDQAGDYADVLPHIVFNKATLPWERKIKNDVPWIVLLCLNKEEIADVKDITAAELCDPTKREGNVFFPLNSLPPLAGESADSVVSVIDIPRRVYKDLFPMPEEAQFLAHVKTVSAVDKDDNHITHDGQYSTVFANRFVPTGAETQLNEIHAVSIEGYTDYFPGMAKESVLDAYEMLRFISLYRWNAPSQGGAPVGFRDVFGEMDVAPLALEPSKTAGDPVKHMLGRGELPRIHKTRSGEVTASVYRGPLVPHNSAKEIDPGNIPPYESPTADHKVIYDCEKGVFNTAYAAAWQIGRLAMLNDKALSHILLRWRQGNRKAHAGKRLNEMLRNRLSEFTEQEGFLEYIARELAGKIIEDGCIAPLASDGRDIDAKLD